MSDKGDSTEDREEQVRINSGSTLGSSVQECDGNGMMLEGASVEAPPPEEYRVEEGNTSNGEETWEDIYPPRTMESVAECEKIVDIMAQKQSDGRPLVSKKQSPVVGIFIYDEKPITVGLSGNPETQTFKDNSLKVQKALDEKYGMGEYLVSAEPIPTELIEHQPQSAEPGCCAEPKLALASNNTKGLPKAMSCRWRGKGKNPYSYDGVDKEALGEKADGEMNPCNTCRYPKNAKAYMQYANSEGN